MGTEVHTRAEAERIKEVIRLLNLALEDCHKCLAKLEHDGTHATHDEPAIPLN